MTRGRVGSGLPLREEVLWPFLDAWDSVRLRTACTAWNVPGRYGPYGELFFFLLKKEPSLQSVGSVWAQHLSRKSESMCLDRFANDG